jgi:hypothetical protein
MWDLFLERSLPLLLTKAASGGLVSTPARRKPEGPPPSQRELAGHTALGGHDDHLKTHSVLGEHDDYL